MLFYLWRLKAQRTMRSTAARNNLKILFLTLVVELVIIILYNKKDEAPSSDPSFLLSLSYAL